MTPVELLLVAAVAVGAAVVFARNHRRERAGVSEALQEKCLVCGAVVALDQDDTYGCGECGLQSAHTRRPDLRAHVEPLRDLQAALHSVGQARRCLAEHKYASARRLLGETDGLLRDVYPAHPELLQRSAAGVALPTEDELRNMAGDLSPLVEVAINTAARLEGEKAPPDPRVLQREALAKVDAWIAEMTAVRHRLGGRLLEQLRGVAAG